MISVGHFPLGAIDFNVIKVRHFCDSARRTLAKTQTGSLLSLHGIVVTIDNTSEGKVRRSDNPTQRMTRHPQNRSRNTYTQGSTVNIFSKLAYLVLSTYWCTHTHLIPFIDILRHSFGFFRQSFGLLSKFAPIFRFIFCNVGNDPLLQTVKNYLTDRVQVWLLFCY